MGFHKRYIRKENILSYLKNGDIVALDREYKLEKLFNADALIMDSWSSKFYDGIDSSERKLRKDLNQKFAIYSTFKFMDDPDYSKIKSLSESLISLMSNDRSWVDVLFTIDKLKIPIEEDERGRFDLLVNKCKFAIIDYFDQ